jgi:hypothetical protein
MDHIGPFMFFRHLPAADSSKRVIIEKKSLTGFPKLDKTAGFHGQQGPLGGAQRFTQFILLSTDRSLKCRQQLR